MIFVCLAVLMTFPIQEPNYDEARVPTYKLPDPLVFNDGSPISNANQWRMRRNEIIQLFEEHVYGSMPKRPHGNERSFAKVVNDTTIAIGSSEQPRVRLKEVQLKLGTRQGAPIGNLAIFLPLDRKSASPVFLAYNFQGNHSVCSSSQVTRNPVWNRERKLVVPEESSRGAKASRWPLAEIVERGYGLVTLYYGDVDPDFDDGFKNGVHPMFPELQDRPDNWASIGAWAWGLHRVMDYLEHDSDVNHRHVALMGHSRLGKTALWAGATDERFPVVISNNSGCGGAAIARRQFGETVARINTNFPHWFCRKHKGYNNRESELPVDQHMLVSLIAPRAVCIASAVEDRWADPRGEFLAAFHAQPVWHLLGKTGLGLQSDKMPLLNRPVGHEIRYHLRSGKHDVKDFDWQQYLDFADRQFRDQKE